MPEGEVAAGTDDARAAAQGTVALAGMQVAGRALALGFVLVATRTLSTSDFGRYAIASALLLGASTVADLGTTAAVTKLVSQRADRADDIVGAALLPSAVLGLLSFAGLCAFVLVGGYPAVTRIDVVLAGLGLPFDAVTTSFLGAFDGRGLIARRARLSMVRVAVIAGGGLLAVFVTKEVRPAIVALAVGPVVTLAFTVVAARRSGLWRGRLRFDRKVVGLLARQAIPFAVLGGINVIVLRADVVVLSILATGAEVARYDVALRATEAWTFLATVIAAPSLFILSRRLGQGDVGGAQRAYDEAVRLAYLLGLPLSAALVALADPLAEFAFGPKYRASGQLLAILGSQLWLAFVAAIQGSLLLAGGELRRAVRLFGAIGVFAVALEVAAIAAYSATGAAWAMVGLQVVIVASAAWFSRRASGVALSWPPVGAIAAAVASEALMAGLSDIGLGWRALAGMMVYGVVLVVTRTVGRRDLTTLLGYLR